MIEERGRLTRELLKRYIYIVKKQSNNLPAKQLHSTNQILQTKVLKQNQIGRYIYREREIEEACAQEGGGE